MRLYFKYFVLSLAFILSFDTNLYAATFETGKTYVISQDIVLSVSETIAPDVTLIFQGGMITSKSSVTLTGTNTKLIAPIGKIFDDKVLVKGSWDIDRAYPQWFGATAYSDFVNYNTTSNIKESGEAINKAITMKQRGEVFLTKGIYIISTPVIVFDGIQLKGVRGIEAHSENKYDGTILQSWKSRNSVISDADDRYMIYVNSDAKKLRITKGGFLASQITQVSDIELYNYIPSGKFSSIQQLQSNTTACIKGIFAYEGFQLDHVRFRNLRQALSYSSNQYIDNKQVTYCDYVCTNENFKLLEHLYAYVLDGFGDNLLFEHNGIHEANYNKGISLYNCLGGSIRNNIINADVKFNNCKAIDFVGNHMEMGAVISIISSQLNMSSNYIERGYNTSMTIEGNNDRNKSIVNMNGDMFIFIDRPRNYPNREEEGSSVNYNMFRSRLNNASEYDIAIDNNAIVSFDQVFRYRIGGYATKTYPMGIKVCKMANQESFDKFNNHSYILSQNGNISSDFNVDKNFSLSNINSLEVHTAMKNSDTYWLGESGTYSYQYQVIYDKERKLLATRNNNQIFNVSNSQDMSGGLTQNNKGGVLLVVADKNGNSTRATIRLIRRRNGSSAFSYVDIPNNNNHFLYDNGISINGYHWQAGTNNDILSGATNIESITFQGNNVVCRISGDHSKSAWKRGDMLINTGNDINWKVVVK